VFGTGKHLVRRQHPASGSGGSTGGIGLGGILVIVVLILWSFWIGLIIAWWA
jgi:hypothetical protein